MPRAGFEPATKRPQTYALDRAATGIGRLKMLPERKYCCHYHHNTGWTTGRSGFDPRRGQRIFPLASVSRPALGYTQLPVQWVPGVLSPGVKRGRGVMLTIHPHLVPRS
jgi:hypothetical protein